MNDRIVMPLWTIGLFIVVMNTTMFNVSIPSIVQDLNISADLGSWIVSSYSIGYALTTVIYSRLSDTVPIRKLLIIGLLILGLSSVLGLFARDFHTLLVARVLQSAGSGAMAGLGLVLASRYVPIERRGRAIAMISAGSAMAFGLGPIVGGIISEFFGWNGLFVVTGLVLVILPLLLRHLPLEQPSKVGFDILGAVLTVANAFTMLLAVTQHSTVWLAVSLLSLLTHVWHMHRYGKKEPFISPDLLKWFGYRKLLLIGFCMVMLNMGNLFLMPLSLALLFSKSALSIGLTIAPGAILSTIMTRFVGRWIDRYGNMRFLLIGHGLIACVMALFYSKLALSPLVILCGYLLFAPAFTATMASLNHETSLILPKKWIGSGLGLLQLTQFFGGSVSVAVCGLLLDVQPNNRRSHAYEHLYGFLLLVCISSMLLLIWYSRSKMIKSTSLPICNRMSDAEITSAHPGRFLKNPGE